MKRSAPPSARSIPTVDFYGDAAEWSTSALLHSEPLIERSRLHAWKIRPHRHKSLAQLFWLERGSGTGRFDAIRHELSAPCVVVVPELCVHEFTWRRGSDGYALSLASALVRELRRQIGAHASTLKLPSVFAAADDDAYVNALFLRIHDEYSNERPMKEISLDSLIKALTIWLARHTAPARGAVPADRASHHYERFAKLVEQHHKSQWTVSDYAAEIGITPPHLNAICHKLSGVSALRTIHDRLLLAARRELTYTEKSIAGVAANLGFSEPSYFTRFFKRQMLMTPKEYRRRSGTVAG